MGDVHPTTPKTNETAKKSLCDLIGLLLAELAAREQQLIAV
jgi:hypothetical protein